MIKPEDYIINDIDLSEVHNRYEIWVLKAMREAIEQDGHLAECRLCLEDVYALTLSRLPALYVQKGSIVLQPELTKKDVLEAVEAAITTILNNPVHS